MVKIPVGWMVVADQATLDRVESKLFGSSTEEMEKR